MASNFRPILPKPAMMHQPIRNSVSFYATCKLVRETIFNKFEVDPDIGTFPEICKLELFKLKEAVVAEPQEDGTYIISTKSCCM